MVQFTEIASDGPPEVASSGSAKAAPLSAGQDAVARNPFLPPVPSSAEQWPETRPGQHQSPLSTTPGASDLSGDPGEFTAGPERQQLQMPAACFDTRACEAAHGPSAGDVPDPCATPRSLFSESPSALIVSQSRSDGLTARASGVTGPTDRYLPTDPSSRSHVSNGQEGFALGEKDGIPQSYTAQFTPLGFLDSVTSMVTASGPNIVSASLFQGPSSERAFEAVPVSDSQLDNAFTVGYRGIENGPKESAPPTVVTGRIVDRVDSLKGYSSDSSSDVDMNSDYTDTITSVTSASLLLANTQADKYAYENVTPTCDKREVTGSEVLPSSHFTAPYYSNKAFADSSTGKALISWPAGESLENTTMGEAHDSLEREAVTRAGHIAETLCGDSSPESEPKMLVERDSPTRKDDAGIVYEIRVSDIVSDIAVSSDSTCVTDKATDEEVRQSDNMEPGCAVKIIVQQFPERHPVDLVHINPDWMNGPVYESVTEPLTELESEEGRSWRQSTESLHLYKLLKQGRHDTADQHLLKRPITPKAITTTSPHERSSFLNLTASSVDNLGRACQKALCYVRNDMEFGSAMSLRDSNLKIASCLSLGGHTRGALVGKDGECAEMLGKKGEPALASGRHTRNVLYMSLVITILLVSINATRNLQSSLNQEGGVGIICLAVTHAAYTFGSLLSPVLVQGLGVKVCITGGLVLELLYVAANLYPVMGLMVPAALGGGFSLAIIWNAMSTYIVLLARGEADSKLLTYERVSDRFFGYFCLIYQSNLIIGNLISSLILTFADGPKTEALLTPLLNGTADLSNFTFNNPTLFDSNASAPGSFSSRTDSVVAADPVGLAALASTSESLVNSTWALVLDAANDTHYHLCGSGFCYHFVVSKEEKVVALPTVYLLFGIFMFLILVAMGIALFLLEPLSPRIFNSHSNPAPSLSSGKSRHILANVRRQMVSLAKFCRNVKFLLLLPLMAYSFMQFTFVSSEVMIAYITCPIGVWLVGYSMMAYGVCCSVSSYVTQALVPWTGRAFSIVLATGLNIGLLVFMKVWQPHPDLVYPLFIVTSLFGIADGIWIINANGMCGSVFPDHYEEAFTGLRVAQGLGAAFSMGYAPFFCMSAKIYVMMVIVVLVLLGYLGAEVVIRKEAKKNAVVVYEKEIL